MNTTIVIQQEFIIASSAKNPYLLLNWNLIVGADGLHFMMRSRRQIFWKRLTLLWACRGRRWDAANVTVIWATSLMTDQKIKQVSDIALTVLVLSFNRKNDFQKLNINYEKAKRSFFQNGKVWNILLELNII